MQEKQQAFWQYAWIKPNSLLKESVVNITDIDLSTKEEVKEIENNVAKNANTDKALISLEYYKNVKKSRKQLEPRRWRTRKDPFEAISQTLLIQLKINPEMNAKDLLKNFIKEFPGKFNMHHLRTLQRRIAGWREKNLQQERNYQLKIMKIIFFQYLFWKNTTTLVFYITALSKNIVPQNSRALVQLLVYKFASPIF